MAHDLSTRRAPTAALARLDIHFAQQLDCPAMLLRRPGRWVHGGTSWATRAHPSLLVEALAVASSGSVVLTTRPDWAQRLEEALASLPAASPPFEADWWPAIAARLPGVTPHGLTVNDVLLYHADGASFRPFGVDLSHKIERWESSADLPGWTGPPDRSPCFIVRDAAGQIASWSALERSSDLAWTITTATLPAYRGRGLATSLTARATSEVLAQGRQALLVSPFGNESTQRLAERLGFERYGRLVRLYDPHRQGAAQPA